MVNTKNLRTACIVTIVQCILVCCGGGAGTPARPIIVKSDFNEGISGWMGSAADYSDSTAPDDVTWAFKALPDPLPGNGYYLAGTNRSDDLFIYAKKKLDGFSPNTVYRATFELHFATNVPSGCAGVGGSPGESVWVFAGASQVEPKTILGVNGDYRVNIDRGQQSQSGKEALCLGNIANSSTDCIQYIYQSKTLSSSSPIVVTSDSNGSLWILVGMDSGFEAFSQIYLLSVTASFLPQT